MKNLLCLFVLITVSACAPEKINRRDEPSIGSEFQPYLNNFIEAGKTFGLDYSDRGVSINFADSLDGSAVGICEASLKGNKVFILKSFWYRANITEWDRESLIFHELAHCILNRYSHNNTMVGTSTTPSYNIPMSLLNTYLVSGYMYSKNRAVYLRELFTSSTGGMSYVY